MAKEPEGYGFHEPERLPLDYRRVLDFAMAVLQDPRNSWMGMGPGSILGFIPKLAKVGARSAVPVKGMLPHDTGELVPAAGRPRGLGLESSPALADPRSDTKPLRHFMPAAAFERPIGTNDESLGLALRAIAESEGNPRAVRDVIREMGGSSSAARNVSENLREGRTSAAGYHANRLDHESHRGPDTLMGESQLVGNEIIRNEHIMQSLDPISREYRDRLGVVNDLRDQALPYMGGKGAEAAMQSLRSRLDKLIQSPGFGKVSKESEPPRTVPYRKQYPKDNPERVRRMSDLDIQRLNEEVANMGPAIERAIANAQPGTLDRILRETGEQASMPSRLEVNMLNAYQNAGQAGFQRRYGVTDEEYGAIREAFSTTRFRDDNDAAINLHRMVSEFTRRRPQE